MTITVSQLLEQARSHIDRVLPASLDDELALGAILVDIRPVEQRTRDGAVPDAMVIDRNVLEWRLSPTSEYRAMDLDASSRVILMCNEGYASSLAAWTLRSLGLSRATDLAGGYQAWMEWHSIV